MALKTWASGEVLNASDLNGNFTEVQRTALTIIPKSVVEESELAPQPVAINNGTTARLGLVVVPFRIVVNKISIRIGLVTTAGALDLTMYSEDGLTQLFSVTTTASPTTASVVTTSVSAVTLLPGNYWLMVNGNGTIDVQTYFWSTQSVPFSTTAGLMGNVTSEPVLQGTLTITSGTPPSTISPTAPTQAYYTTPIVRLDN